MNAAKKFQAYCIVDGRRIKNTEILHGESIVENRIHFRRFYYRVGPTDRSDVLCGFIFWFLPAARADE